MKEFKGLKTPPVGKPFANLQAAFCTASSKCINDCSQCIYDKSNLVRFIEFLKSNKKPVVNS